MMPKCRQVLRKSLLLRCGLSYSYFTCSNFWSPSSSWPLTTSWGKVYSRFNFVKLTIYRVVSLCQIFIIFCESKVNFQKHAKKTTKNDKKRRKTPEKSPKNPRPKTCQLYQKITSTRSTRAKSSQQDKRGHTNLRY